MYIKKGTVNSFAHFPESLGFLKLPHGGVSKLARAVLLLKCLILLLLSEPIHIQVAFSAP